MAGHEQTKIPVLLLKTKSAPVDLYEELFSTCDGSRYAPVFVPVLEHRFNSSAVDEVRQHIVGRGFVPECQQGRATYGALIFTSQRAVEAFAEVVEDLRKEASHAVDELLPESLPLYVVGPATARGLRALNLRCPILGEETGTGEVLAGLILEHYNSIYTGSSKPAILFLVGDKRRDIIPRTLQSEELGVDKRLKVDERVIYETGEMQSFRANFSKLWQENAENGLKRQWVVVFSPSGCQAMLESLGLLDAATGKAKPVNHQRDIFIATIGPTTRDYLSDEFGFLPDVCAETPTPEGVIAGIQAFLQQRES
jgi:uroporphyrinogen-III synthase